MATPAVAATVAAAMGSVAAATAAVMVAVMMSAQPVVSVRALGQGLAAARAALILWP